MCRVIPGHRKVAQGMRMISGQQKKRLTGVGPAYLAWEASVLPMYYSRIMHIFYAEYQNFSITICILVQIDKCEIAEICYTMKTSKERGILCD